MPRLFLLLLLLLIPASAFADALSAAGLGQALPFILAILLIGVAILVAGCVVAKHDFNSARENPRPLNLILILLGVAAGTLFSLLGQFGSHRSHHATPFPNILTEVYVPYALLLIARKKFRFAASNPSRLYWLGVMAAWIIVLISGITGLLFITDGFGQPNLSSLVGALLILAAWLLLFRKHGRQALPLGETGGSLWQVLIVGAGVAALYASALQLLRSLVAGELRDFDFFQLVAAEVIYFVICLLMGGLVLISTSITNSRINPNSQ